MSISASFGKYIRKFVGCTVVKKKKKQFVEIAYHVTAFYCKLIPLKRKKKRKFEWRRVFFSHKNTIKL